MGTESDADLVESMAAFEAAVESEAIELPPIPISTVVLGLDQSNQDEAAKALAGEVCRRTGARLLVTYAYAGAREDAKEQYLERQAKELSAAAVWGEGEHPFERLLAALESAAGDLLVLPAPYLADINVLGHESLGPSLDLVLARARTPVLVVRQPLPSIAAALDEILIPITFANRENARACSLALRLAAPGTRIALLAVADRRVLANAAHLLGSFLDPKALDPETLGALEAKEHGSLIAALQKACAERSLSATVRVEVGDPLEVVQTRSNEHLSLSIIAAPEDHRAAAFQQVLAFLRQARNPVLVV